MGSRGIWIATILILVVGFIVFFALDRSDRTRRSAMCGVAVGAPAEQVNQALGLTPRRCPPGPLDHLRESFPEGWTPASIDIALEQLEAQTAERWVYPVDGETVECAGLTTRTEVGVSADRTVLWSIAVLGGTVVRLPATVSPAGGDSVAAVPDPQ